MKLDNDTKRKLYRSLYQEAFELFKKYDPCYASNGKCVRTLFGNAGMCCEKCKYLDDKGCTVRSLVCKLWLCDDVVKVVNKDFKEKAKNIFLRAYVHDLVMFRASEDDVIYGFKVNGTAYVQMPWGKSYVIPSAQDVSEC